MFYFHPYLGKIPILTNIFQMGWNHQLDKIHGIGTTPEDVSECHLKFGTFIKKGNEKSSFAIHFQGTC